MYWKYFGCCVYKDTNRNIRYVNIFSWTKTVWWSVARRCKRVQLNSNKRWIKHSLSKQGLLPGDALISSLSVCQECEGFCPLPRTFFPWHEMQKVTKSQLSRHSLALQLWFLKLTFLQEFQCTWEEVNEWQVRSSAGGRGGGKVSCCPATS